MSTQNTTSTRLSSVGYKSRDFQQDTYKAYLSYLHAVEEPSKSNDVKAFNAFKAIAVKFGYEIDYYADFVHGVTSYMESYTAMKDNPTQKIKSLSSFRQLFTRDILAKIQKSIITYTVPKAPATPAKKQAKKQAAKMTAKEVKAIEAENANLQAELAKAREALKAMGVYSSALNSVGSAPAGLKKAC